MMLPPLLWFLLCVLVQPGFVSSEEQVLRLVQPSVEHVCRLRLPSGNYPPCVGDDRDQLVHWCHGAPGVFYMLLQAYKVSSPCICPLVLVFCGCRRRLVVVFYCCRCWGTRGTWRRRCIAGRWCGTGGF